MTANAWADIPDALRQVDQWVCWRRVSRPDRPKPMKVPIDPATGRSASVADPNTWGSFEAAYRRAEQDCCDGIGFVFASTDPFVGVDLDQCRDPETGAIDNLAQSIIDQVASYTEVSPSGQGIRIVVRGNFPEPGRKQGSVEIYRERHFLTFTGQHLPGTPRTIEERTVELNDIYGRIFSTPRWCALTTEMVGLPGEPPPSIRLQSLTLEEITLIEKAKAATNGPKFTKLWQGDWSGYPSQSEADLALCRLLSYWTNGDSVLIDRLFRHSGLFRSKWDAPHLAGGTTYGQATIATAISALRQPSAVNHVVVQTSNQASGGSTTSNWPAPVGKEAFYGFAGRVVDLIDPFTEADPVAVLAHFLLAFGSAVGAGPHAMVGATRHPVRTNAVLVGPSGKARKGESWSPVRALFQAADPDWVKDRVVTGLSSGEGLIWAVRDPITKTEPVKEKGHVVNYQEVIEDHGVTDKRLLMLEPEFGRVLKVKNREANTLSPLIREAWDTGHLRSLTKNSPAVATGAHIAIVGHITRDELRRELHDVDAANGFANRFLWLCVRRSKLLPEPAPFEGPAVDQLVQELVAILAWAKTVDRIERDEEARAYWRSLYPTLSAEREGPTGAMLARAEAHVTRLSLLYALLDQSSIVSKAHLEAALTLWEYSERSVEYLFGHRTLDETSPVLQLKRLLQDGPMQRGAVLHALHWTAFKLDSTLEAANGAIRQFERSTGGRPAQWLELVNEQ